MCSIGEEDFGDDGAAHLMPPDPKIQSSEFISNEICKKCKERSVVVKLNLKDAQCEQCFLQYIRHKFRATMGATRIIDRGAKVLLVFEHTKESYVMFDMVRYALTQEQFKRLTIEPIAVFVDNSCLNQNVLFDKRKIFLQQTFKVMKAFKFNAYYYTSIASASAIDIENAIDYVSSAVNSDIENKFIEKMNAIDKHSAKEDFLSISRSNVIREVGSKVGCKYVFVSTISHDIAANLLINVALGRGNSVANNISFCDDRTDCDSKILRPMRTITALEIDTYLRLNENLNKLINANDNIVNNSCSSLSVPSIQNLTKQFIESLQENFDSTVSTIFRTGDKISTVAASTIPFAQNAHCKFCHSILDYEDSATLFAIEYSRCVSACVDQEIVNDLSLMFKRAQKQLLGQNDESSSESLMKCLCHGCRNIFRNLDHADL